jgi:hypothetical protein
LKFLLEAADQGVHLTLIPSKVEQKDSEARLISFSGFITFVKSKRLEIPPELLQLDAEVRAQDGGSLADPNESETVQAKANQGSVKVWNLEITLGAFVLLLGEYAQSKSPIPTSLLSGEKLSQSALANKIEKIIEVVLAEGGAKRGHSAGAVRRTISSALKQHFPPPSYIELVSTKDTASSYVRAHLTGICRRCGASGGCHPVTGLTCAVTPYAYCSWW